MKCLHGPKSPTHRSRPVEKCQTIIDETFLFVAKRLAGQALDFQQGIRFLLLGEHRPTHAAKFMPTVGPCRNRVFQQLFRVPPDELKSSLAEFVSFAQSLKGDEKSESQSFLDQFFRALGHKSAIEAGATFEFRVAKKPGSPQLELIKGNGSESPRKGGKKFADLLWPDRVLIEMKSRGTKLEKYYDQAFDYWTHIVPKRPPFVILCNFDEFWIYDFNTQLFDPVDLIKLAELPENVSSFNFLLPIWKKPIFGNNWVDVTRRAADQMAESFKEIVGRGEDRQRTQ